MALTKIGTDGVKDDAITSGKIPANAVGSSEIADTSVTLAKLEHGTSSNDGKFLRANNGGDPTFEFTPTKTVIRSPDTTSTSIQCENAQIEVTGKVNWDNDPNNTYGISFDAPTTLTKDSNFTLPEDGSNGQFLKTNGSGVLSFATVSTTPEGTAVLSTGETGGSKFLREDGDGSCSWQSVPAGITVNNQADTRVITATGTTNTLNAESGFVYNDSTGNASIGGSPATGSRLRLMQASATDYDASTAANNPALIIGASSGGGADNKCVGFSINGPNPNAEFNAAMVGNGANEADFFVSMRSGGSRSDRFRMTHDKQIFLISNSNQHAKLLNDGNVFELKTEGTGNQNYGMLIFRDGSNDFCGQITSNGSNNTTSYGTSSDYRLKTNATSIADGITRVKNLKPYKFEWKTNLGEKVDGFFAHEAQTVVPEAVTGVKDEMLSILYKEGEEIPEGKKVGDVKEVSTTEIKPQTIDQSKLVPLLTAALQEAIAKIETLETKVAALEAA